MSKRSRFEALSARGEIGVFFCLLETIPKMTPDPKFVREICLAFVFSVSEGHKIM